MRRRQYAQQRIVAAVAVAATEHTAEDGRDCGTSRHAAAFDGAVQQLEIAADQIRLVAIEVRGVAPQDDVVSQVLDGGGTAFFVRVQRTALDRTMIVDEGDVVEFGAQRERMRKRIVVDRAAIAGAVAIEGDRVQCGVQ